MKNAWMLLLVMLSLSILSPDTCQAQILKGFGKKVENKLKNKVEEKAERHVDKTINTADRKSDESIEKTIKGDKKQTKKQNTKKKKNKEVISNSNVPIRKDQAMTMFRSGACQDFLWFKEGTVFQYQQKISAHTSSNLSTMRIQSVSQQSGKTISEIHAKQESSDGDVELQLKYVCDGSNFYIDISAMYEQILQQMQQANTNTQQVKEAISNAELDVSEGFTAFPQTLYPGMQLPDASFKLSMNTNGMDMVMNSIVTDRVVEAKESITTSAGTFECMKIRSTSQVSMQMMGRIINTQTSTDYTWLAPEIGLVKQELYTKNKLEYSTELTGLNKVK